MPAVQPRKGEWQSPICAHAIWIKQPSRGSVVGLAMLTSATASDDPLAARFTQFVKEPLFPCVGAKAALGKGRIELLVAHDICSGWDDLPIVEALLAMAARYRADPTPFQSLAVLFRDSEMLDETTFERHLWARLQSLSDKDQWLGLRPDPRVSSDPDNPHFSLSFGGEAFFVVGLHPGSSRAARRFDVPAMIFNPHDQFVRLREAGRYEGLRDAIVERDARFSGSINPMLAAHGNISAARQYSGRAVGEDWACPFNRGSEESADAP